MADRIESGDALIVHATIEALSAHTIHIRSLDLDGVYLKSAAAELQLTVLAAVATFERYRIKERIRAGLDRTSKNDGRPVVLHTTVPFKPRKLAGFLSQ
ncbi:recombinase family protein [Pseudomonas syringae]|uniref:recombinase family protein n=1 Tax=Pseudomonas syringae TaxID=317 RepID=UPI000EFFFF5C|nr:recombinase family protein [Pseudomonas syringae]